MGETMIERMAKAILKHRFYDCEPAAYGDDLDAFYASLDGDHIVDAHDEARAALLELREPTKAMQDALSWREAFGDVTYQAGIDAALNEVPA